MHQVVQVFRAVEKFVGFHAFRHIQWNGAKGCGDFSGADGHVGGVAAMLLGAEYSRWMTPLLVVRRIHRN
jgi:hypothetical protein